MVRLLAVDRLLLGKKTGALDYACLMGRRMPAGYDKMSELWVFPKQVAGMFDNRVDVYSLSDFGTIELDMSKQGNEDPLFFILCQEGGLTSTLCNLGETEH